jgi:indolepyruvate decarboxylase
MQETYDHNESSQNEAIGSTKHSSTARANGNSDWDYAGIMTVFNSTDGDGKGFRSTTGKELAEAIQGALAHKIERTIDRDDCTKQLIEWGSRVAAANGRPPQRA